MGIFDRSERTVLGSPLGGSSGGGGITWATPVDSSVTLSAHDTYNLGTASVAFLSIYAGSGGFVTDDGAGISTSVYQGGMGSINSTAQFWKELYSDTDPDGVVGIFGKIYTDGGALPPLDISSASKIWVRAATNLNLIAGNTGTIKLQKSGVLNNVGDVWTATGVNGEGYWAAPSGGASFPLLAPDGTVAAPSYSFSGNTDTGLYLDLGTTLAFSVDGASKFTISASSTIFRQSAGPNSVGVSLGTLGNPFGNVASATFIAKNFSNTDQLFIRGNTAQTTPSGVSMNPTIKTAVSATGLGIMTETGQPIYMETGNNTTGNTGLLNIQTGNQTGVGGIGTVTGDLSLRTGTATGSGTSGSITIQTGVSAATRGKIILQDGSQGTIGHVWTSTGVNGEGAWAAAGAAGANTALSNLTSPTSINQDLTFQSNKSLINLNQIRLRKTVSDFGAPIEVGTGAVNVGAFIAVRTTGAGSSYVYMTNGTQVCGFGQDGTGFQGLIPGGFVFGNLGGNTQDVAAMQNGTFRFRITSTYVGVESVPFRFPSFASAPGTPGVGDSYYDTTTNKVYTWDGATWQPHF